MVKASLSECLSLLNEHINLHLEMGDYHSRLDYHLKYAEILSKQAKHRTNKMLWELMGLSERLLDQLDRGEFKNDKR